MSINWDKVRRTLRGAWKSWSIWFGGIVALLPEAIPLIRDNFTEFAPLIPAALQSPVMHWLGAIVVLLRLKTTTALHDKSLPKDDGKDSGV